MADEVTTIGFATNIGAVVDEVGSGMSRLVADLERAGSSIGGVQFGDQVVANFEASMRKVRQLAAETAKAAADEMNRAGRAAGPTTPFAQPGGGALNTQLGAIEAEAVRGMEQIFKGLVEQAPAMRATLQQAARTGVEAMAAELRGIGNAASAQFKQIAAEQRAQGVALPVRQAITGGGQQTAAGDKRIQQAFPALTSAQLAEVDTYQAERRSAAAVRGAATRKANAAERAAADAAVAAAEAAPVATDLTASEKRSAAAIKGAATRRANAAEKAAQSAEQSASADAIVAAQGRARAGLAVRGPADPEKTAAGRVRSAAAKEVLQAGLPQVLTEETAPAEKALTAAAKSSTEALGQQLTVMERKAGGARALASGLEGVAGAESRTTKASREAAASLDQNVQATERLTAAQRKLAGGGGRVPPPALPAAGAAGFADDDKSQEAVAARARANRDAAAARDQSKAAATPPVTPVTPTLTAGELRAARYQDSVARQAEKDAAAQQLAADRKTAADRKSADVAEAKAEKARLRAAAQDKRDEEAANLGIKQQLERELLARVEAGVPTGEFVPVGKSAYVGAGTAYKTTQSGGGLRELEDAELTKSMREAQYKLNQDNLRSLKQDNVAADRVTRARETEATEAEQAANAAHIADQYAKGLATRAGAYWQTAQGTFRETDAGAERLSGLKLIRANEALASARERQAIDEARATPKGFIGSFVSSATSKSAFGGGTGPQLPIADKLGGRLGSLTETFAGFAVLGLAIKALADTRTEVIAYTSALVNLEAVTGRTDVTTASFTNDLEGLSRLAGSNVSDQINAATRAMAAFGETTTDSKARLQQIGEEGAKASSVFAVVTGTKLTEASNNVVAIASSFGTKDPSQYSRVADAAANAQRLGGEQAVIGEGLGAWAEGAKAAGYSLDQAANIVSKVTAITNESGLSVATKLNTIQQLAGSHQDYLKGLGVDTNGTSFREQIAQLRPIYAGLPEDQKKELISKLGGRSAGRELYPLLTEGPALDQADAYSAAHPGAGQTQFDEKNASLAGLFRKITGDLTAIQLNLARSGIFNDIGLALKVLEPGLKVLSDFTGAIDKLISAFGPLKSLPGIFIDTAGALLLLAKVGKLPLLAEALIPSLARTKPLPGLITTAASTQVGRVRNVVGVGGAGADAAANSADTAAVNANTTAKARAAAQNVRAAASEEALARAKAEGIKYTLAQRNSIIALQEQIDLQALALADLVGVQDLELKTQGKMVGANEAEIGSLKVLAAAEREQIVILEEMAVAAKEAAAANRSGFLGLGVGNRIQVARNNRNPTETGEPTAAAGLGAVGKASVVLGAAIVVDSIWTGINDQAKKAKEALDGTAQALSAVASAASSDEMHSAAADLRAAADKTGNSTSGKLGATIGFFHKYFGDGTDTNAISKNQRQGADLLDKLADQSAVYEQQAASQGSAAVFGGNPNDAESQAKGFAALTAAGVLPAKQQALFIEANSGGGLGPNHVLSGSQHALGQQFFAAYRDLDTNALGDEIASEDPLLAALSKKKGGQSYDPQAAARQLLTYPKLKLDEPGAATALQFGGGFGPNKSPLVDGLGLVQQQQKAQKLLEDWVSKNHLENGGLITDAMANDFADQAASLYIGGPGETQKQLAAGRAKFRDKAKAFLKQVTDQQAKPVEQIASEVGQLANLPAAAAAGQAVLAQTGGDKTAAALEAYQTDYKRNLDVLNHHDKAGVGNHLTDAAVTQTAIDLQAYKDSTQADKQNFATIATSLRSTDDLVGRAYDAWQIALNQLAYDKENHKPAAEINGQAAAATIAQHAYYLQGIADQVKRIDDAVPPDNPVASADATVKGDKLTLRGLGYQPYSGGGRPATVPKNGAVADELKKLAEDEVSAVKARVLDANAVARSLIPPGNSTASLGQDAKEAKQTFDTLKKQDHVAAGVLAAAWGQWQTALYDFQRQTLLDGFQIAEAAVPANDPKLLDALKASDARKLVGFDKAHKVGGQTLATDLGAAQSASGTAATDQTQLANDAADAAVKVGDSYGEAYTQYLDMVRTANSKVGAERAKLLRDAAVQKVVAEKLAVDIAHGARVNAIDPRDELALAREALRNDKAAQQVQGQPTEQLAQEVLQGKQDALAVQQAEAARNAAKLTSQVRQGDPLSGAAAALTNAKDNLKLDEQGTLKYFTDLAAVKQAAVAYAQAFRDRARENLLLAGDTTDPLTQARADLAAATAKLNDDRKKKTGDLRQDQLNKETAEAAAQKAQFDQQLQQQQTAYGLQQESAGAFLGFLNGQDKSLRTQIAGMKKGQQGYQQYVDELNQIDQAIQGLNNQLSGQFNLGDIKLPTVYEVRRQVSSSAAGQNIDASASTVVNNVNINGADFAAVVAYITSILGNRGGSRVATTGRKAA